MIIKNIPFELDAENLIKNLHLPSSPEYEDIMKNIIKLAKNNGKPKALYKVSEASRESKPTVKVDEVTFKSSVLWNKFQNLSKVFPFVVTCGNELERVSQYSKDFFIRYLWDVVKEKVLQQSVDYLTEVISKEYNLNNVSIINPGFGNVNLWPLKQQKQLFLLFPEVEEKIGLKLTDECLMIPGKSISGLAFSAYKNFSVCELCDRENCRSREKRYFEES